MTIATPRYGVTVGAEKAESPFLASRHARARPQVEIIVQATCISVQTVRRYWERGAKAGERNRRDALEPPRLLLKTHQGKDDLRRLLYDRRANSDRKKSETKRTLRKRAENGKKARRGAKPEKPKHRAIARRRFPHSAQHLVAAQLVADRFRRIGKSCLTANGIRPGCVRARRVKERGLVLDSRRHATRHASSRQCRKRAQLPC